MDNNENNRPQGELLVYQGQGLASPVQVRLEGETVWLSQRLLAELYGVSVPTINEHIATIYDDEELLPEATIRKFRIVQTEGTARRAPTASGMTTAFAVGAQGLRPIEPFDSSFWAHAMRPYTKHRASLAMRCFFISKDQHADTHNRFGS